FSCRFSNVGNEPRKRYRVLVQTRSCSGGTLRFTSVTLIAADLRKQDLTVFSVSARGRSLREHQNKQYEKMHVTPYRGCVTTSTSAGSPRFTAATARLIAGPRFLGSVIGPSA